MNQAHPAFFETQIEPRFNGPPGMGNGGIVCALLAEHCEGAFEAELRAPAPLEQPLTIDRGVDGEISLRDGDRLIACARERRLELDVPEPPSWRDAERAHASRVDAAHPFPHCFVCGPARAAGDGLRVIAGPIEGRDGLVATPWRPDASFVDETTGVVAERFVIAALDCPGGIAALRGRQSPILLARFHGHVARAPVADERCMLMGWPIRSEGRKHVAGSALLDEAGRVLGRAEALWIEPRG